MAMDHATPELLTRPLQPCRPPRAWALALLLGCASASASAAGPTGPIGPTGPVGPIGPSAGAAAPPAATPARPSPATPAPAPAPRAPARTGNHIEATGNSASGAGCGGAVNSIDIQGARLEGRTVIVQGRNVQGRRSGPDCAAASAPAQGQVNSIRIR